MATVIQDGFSGTSGTGLNGRTPDTTNNGNTWFDMGQFSAIGGAEVNGSGKVIFQNNNGGACIDAGYADVTIDADWTPATSSLNRNSIVFRYVDDNNMWYFNVREDNGDVQLLEFDAATNSTRASASYSFSEGTTYALRVVLSGSSISCRVNGSEVLSYTSSLHSTATKHGLLRNGGSSTTTMDNFVIDYTAPAATIAASRRILNLS